MLGFLGKPTIAGRMWLTAAIALVALGLSGLNAARVLKQSIFEDRRAEIRATGETAYSVIAAYGALARSGGMSESAAKGAAMDILRSARYEGNEYFWINDRQGRFVMHPMKPELVGKEAGETRDPQGRIITLEFVRAVEVGNGEAFVEYVWPRPGDTEPIGKISFVKLYEPWGWIVGTGAYVDDLEQAVAREMWRGAVAFAIVALFLAVAVYLVGRSLKGGVRALLR